MVYIFSIFLLIKIYDRLIAPFATGGYLPLGKGETVVRIHQIQLEQVCCDSVGYSCFTFIFYHAL